MLEQLLHFDHQFFLAINQGLANPFFDWLMPLLRNKYFWFPLYLFLIIFLVKKYRKDGILCIIFLLVTFALADSISASLMKPIFERLRPCNEPIFNASIRSLVACGTGFSFPSSHAANHFAIAVFLTTVFAKRWKILYYLAYGWAFSIAFAQVYVGVHFPIDVSIGALLGCAVGYITGSVCLMTIFEKRWNTGK